MNDNLAPLPIASSGYVASRFNALGHGILSRQTVLAWEDRAEYEALFGELVADHKPDGATQLHLVEEIAGIIWRKRRLRLAEAASHRQALDRAGDNPSTVRHALSHMRPKKITDSVKDALNATAEETTDDLTSVTEELGHCERFVELLEGGKKSTYNDVLEQMQADTRNWFLRFVDGSYEPDDRHRYEPTAPDLDRFIQKEVLPWLESRKVELENRHLIREQAYGASLNIDALDKLARYEVHLDRKLEKSLGMLYRLKELAAQSGPSVSQKEPDEA